MHYQPTDRLLKVTNCLVIVLLATGISGFIATATGLTSLASAYLIKPSPTPMDLNPEAVGGVITQSDRDPVAWLHEISPSKPAPSAQPSPGTTPAAAPVVTEKKPETTPVVQTAVAAEPYFIVPIAYNNVARGLIRGVHTGIDYVANTGTAVLASHGGKVIEADSVGYNGGWGKYVLIEHEPGVTTRYAHLSKISVHKGQDVKQGDTIALSGNTGRSTGPHLHFELRVNGVAKNPFGSK